MTLFWFRINCFNEFVRQRVQNDFRMTLYKWNKENISKHLKKISKIWLILPIYIANSGKMKKKIIPSCIPNVFSLPKFQKSILRKRAATSFNFRPWLAIKYQIAIK